MAIMMDDYECTRYCGNNSAGLSILHGCLADTFYPSPNSFHNLPLRLRQFFAHIKDVIMSYLIANESNAYFQTSGRGCSPRHGSERLRNVRRTASAYPTSLRAH